MVLANAINLQDQGVAYMSTTGTFSGIDGSTAGNALRSNGTGVAPSFQAVTGLVTGPATSTNRSIATWNGTGGAALFDNPTINIDSTGRMTNTAQPAFSAFLSASVANVTGEGTIYKVIFDSVTQQGSNYNPATGDFTAPVTGFYLFSTGITISNVTATAVGSNIAFYIGTTSAYLFATNKPFTYQTGGLAGNSGSFLVKLTAGNVLNVRITVSGSQKNVGVIGTQGSAPATQYNYFSGVLIC